MSLMLKDAGATVDYAVDWASLYLGTGSIAASSWQASPVEDGGLAVLADAVEAGVALVTVTGGIAGHVYRLTNRVTLVGGRSDERTLTIRVEAR